MWAEFAGYCFTWSEQAAKRHGLIHVPGVCEPGLGRDQLHTGGNGGYQAVNLAYLLGASRICLLGYDMQRTRGRSHWHGDHVHTSNPSAKLLRQWADNFDRLHRELAAAGVSLINGSRETALRVPRMEFEACLRLTGDSEASSSPGRIAAAQP